MGNGYGSRHFPQRTQTGNPTTVAAVLLDFSTLRGTNPKDTTNTLVMFIGE